MAEILKGADVTNALNKSLKERTEILKKKGINPVLAIVRVGEKDDDISYEKGVEKRCNKVGAEVKKFIFPNDISEKEILNAVEEINQNDKIHGCLILKPLPSHIDENKIRETLAIEKDIDGTTNGSLVGVFTDTDYGYPPCTAQACMEILDFYGINPQGKRAVVIGRSLVVGKPTSMLLINRNATVTVCHTKTINAEEICRNAEILIVAAGKAETVGKEFLNKNQIVIDVGIHVNADGKLTGDVKFDEAEHIVKAITPVPGGVGTVTTSVLVKHVIMAAEKAAENL